MITIDVSDWKRYDTLLEQRMQRCQHLPGELVQQCFAKIKAFIEAELVVADESISFRAQKSYLAQTGTGMFGKGTSPTPDWKIGAQEKMGGVDWPGKPPSPHFLESMSVQVSSQGGRHEMDILTGSIMQPYPQIGGQFELPAKPIMFYLRRGWKSSSGGPEMRPRLGSPGMEVAKFLQAGGVAEQLSGPILHWIVRGEA